MSNIFDWVKKKDLFGLFLNKRNCGNDNEISLKERGGIEMSTSVLPLRDARSLSLDLLTFNLPCIFICTEICWRCTYKKLY